MSIWFKKSLHCESLNEMSKDSLGEWLGIRFTEIGENYLKASMPVDHRTIQPFGYLHGGASAAMAETMGSVGAVLVVDPAQFLVLGVEINANHVRAVREGTVFGMAVPLHIGGSSHVWEIKISDDRGKLICISRLTVFIKRKGKSSMPGADTPLPSILQ